MLVVTKDGKEEDKSASESAYVVLFLPAVAQPYNGSLGPPAIMFGAATGGCAATFSGPKGSKNNNKNTGL